LNGGFDSSEVKRDKAIATSIGIPKKIQTSYETCPNLKEKMVGLLLPLIDPETSHTDKQLSNSPDFFKFST
jgi:hypothetical protein